MTTGAGYSDRLLTEEDVREVVEASLSHGAWKGKKVLALIPDSTRSCPLSLLYKSVYEQLAPYVKSFDILVALGTHHPMTDEELYARMGISAQEHAADYPKTKFFNHHWRDPECLAQIGVISERKVSEISAGLFKMEVPLTVNRKILEYDHLMVLGPVFPHEVVGFSGGNKYFFPGIAGKEIIDFFHWLGAVITNINIIGTKQTPVRAVVDHAASFIKTEKSCFAMVVEGDGLAGLYYGTPEEAWNSAADLSRHVHITYKEKPFHTVLSVAPKMYDDLWVGGKCMYKLEPVVADGGTLIIYAPHITEISYTHGKVIDEIGYHTRDYFMKQWDSYMHYPWGVLAHSTHVKGGGTFEDGAEKPRVDVVLATGIPEERCRKVNLGYVDHRKISFDFYKGREADGILFVPKAGELLYRLE